MKCPDCHGESAVCGVMSLPGFVHRNRQCKVCHIAWSTEEQVRHIDRNAPRLRHYGGKTWTEARAAALDRDGHRCIVCGRTDKLHVHHKRKQREFDSHEEAHALDNLETVCSGCHRKRENRR